MTCTNVARACHVSDGQKWWQLSFDGTKTGLFCAWINGACQFCSISLCRLISPCKHGRHLLPSQWTNQLRGSDGVTLATQCLDHAVHRQESRTTQPKRPMKAHVVPILYTIFGEVLRSVLSAQRTHSCPFTSGEVAIFLRGSCTIAKSLLM